MSNPTEPGSSYKDGVKGRWITSFLGDTPGSRVFLHAVRMKTIARKRALRKKRNDDPRTCRTRHDELGKEDNADEGPQYGSLNPDTQSPAASSSVDKAPSELNKPIFNATHRPKRRSEDTAYKGLRSMSPTQSSNLDEISAKIPGSVSHEPSFDGDLISNEPSKPIHAIESTSSVRHSGVGNAGEESPVNTTGPGSAMVVGAVKEMRLTGPRPTYGLGGDLETTEEGQPGPAMSVSK